MKKIVLLMVLIFILQTCAYGASYSWGSCQFCAPQRGNSSRVESSKTTKYKADDGKFLNAKASEVISQVNAERAKYGLGKLKYDEDLTLAAMKRAMEISQKFSHTRPDGSKWSTISSQAYAENIARGHSSVDRVMAAWLTSDGHRKNILKKSYTSIGVAVYRQNGILHWVQLFGKG